MTSPVLTIDEIARRLRPVMRKRAVRRALLFGSYARGEATKHSDIDLLIVMDTALRFLDRYDGMLRDLTEVVAGPAVEPLIYTPAELDSMRDRPFIRQALREGISVYEYDQGET